MERGSDTVVGFRSDSTLHGRKPTKTRPLIKAINKHNKHNQTRLRTRIIPLSRASLPKSSYFKIPKRRDLRRIVPSTRPERPKS